MIIIAVLFIYKTKICETLITISAVKSFCSNYKYFFKCWSFMSDWVWCFKNVFLIFIGCSLEEWLVHYLYSLVIQITELRSSNHFHGYKKEFSEVQHGTMIGCNLIRKSNFLIYLLLNIPQSAVTGIMTE